MAKRVTKGNLWGFIQSRPYATIADIRRLFQLDVEGVAPVVTGEGTYYVGLPPEAASLLRQLWQEGRIVFDINLDVKGKVVQGVYPARVPLGRQTTGKGVLARAGEPERGQPGEPTAAQPASGKRRRRRRRRSAAAAAGSVGPAEGDGASASVASAASMIAQGAGA